MGAFGARVSGKAASSIVQSLTRGGGIPEEYEGHVTPDVARALLEQHGAAFGKGRGFEVLSKIAGRPPANDLVMQIGKGGVKFAQRVDPGDVGVFAKPDGALAGAGKAGGGNVNVNHFYNDAKANWVAVQRMMGAL